MLPSTPKCFNYDELLDLLLEGIGPMSKSRSLLLGYHAALLIELLNAMPPPPRRDIREPPPLSTSRGELDAPYLLRI